MLALHLYLRLSSLSLPVKTQHTVVVEGYQEYTQKKEYLLKNIITIIKLKKFTAMDT
jgi:hypothetical protein